MDSEIAAFRSFTGTLVLSKRQWFVPVAFHNRRDTLDPYSRKPTLSDPQATARAEDINLVQERVLLGLYAFVNDVDAILGRYRFTLADFRSAFRAALAVAKASLLALMAQTENDVRAYLAQFDADVRADITAFEAELRARITRLNAVMDAELDAAWLSRRGPFDSALTYADLLSAALVRLRDLRALGLEN